jgi:hypothetical protein
VARVPKKPVALQEIEIGRLLAPDPWAAEIALPGGTLLRLKGSADPEWVRAICEKLHKPC